MLDVRCLRRFMLLCEGEKMGLDRGLGSREYGKMEIDATGKQGLVRIK